MFKAMRTKRRHAELMRAARHLVHERHTNWILRQPLPHHVEPDDLIALVFGRLNLRIDEEEAARYLEAARVAEGLDRDGATYETDADEDQEPDEVAAEEPAQV